MIRRLPILLLLSAAGLCAAVAPAAGAPPAASAPAPSAAQAPASASAPAPAPTPVAAAAPGFHRVELPGAAGKKFPYSIEVPQDWTLHEIKDQPALLWLGPDGIDPQADSRLVWVRLSTAALGKPEDVVANFKKTVPADGSWVAPVVEVREVGGVRGVWVQMSSKAANATRKTLILKLPLPKTSVDFMASAPADAFDQMLPEYERILKSVRPVS